ncbi:MAG: hypothetical protein R3Y56_02310 [Akkermansia sp.]
MNTTNTNTNTDTKTTWLKTWLQSLGMSQTWANIIATALVAAATAVFAMTQNSCTTSSTTTISSTPTGGLTVEWQQACPPIPNTSTGTVTLVDGNAK